MPRRFSHDYPAWSESVLFYCSAKSQSLLTGSGFCLSLAACFSTIGLGGAQISRGAFRCRRRFSYDYPAWSESVLFYCSAKSQSLLTGSGFCLSLAACFSTIGLGGAQISRGAFRCRRRFSYDYPAWSESVLFYCLAENSTGRKASCGRRLSSAASAAAKAAANKTAAAAACMDGFRRR